MRSQWQVQSPAQNILKVQTVKTLLLMVRFMASHLGLSMLFDISAPLCSVYVGTVTTWAPYDAPQALLTWCSQQDSNAWEDLDHVQSDEGGQGESCVSRPKGSGRTGELLFQRVGLTQHRPREEKTARAPDQGGAFHMKRGAGNALPGISTPGASEPAHNGLEKDTLRELHFPKQEINPNTISPLVSQRKDCLPKCF